MASSSKFNTGLPTTQVWDPAEIEQMDVNTPEFKRFLLSMHQNMNSMALSINEKYSGTQSSEANIVGTVDLGGVNASKTFPGGKTTFDLYRKIINMGPIHNTGGGVVAFSIPHNLANPNNGNLVVIRLSGVANRIYNTDAGFNFRTVATPIPFVDAANATYANDKRNAALWLDGTNVMIRLGGTANALWEEGFNHVFVTIEYIYVPY